MNFPFDISFSKIEVVLPWGGYPVFKFIKGPFAGVVFPQTTTKIKKVSVARIFDKSSVFETNGVYV